MPTHPRPPAQRPSLSLILLLALLLPLLAACGGSAGSAGGSTPVNGGLAPRGGVPSAPVESNRGSIVAAPTAAPEVAVGGGVAAPTATMAAAAEAPRSDAGVAEPAAGMTGGAPVTIATPIVPPERVQGQQQGAPLKAGEVDD